MFNYLPLYDKNQHQGLLHAREAGLAALLPELLLYKCIYLSQYESSNKCLLTYLLTKRNL